MNPTTCMCNNYKTLDWLKELSVEQCRQVIVDRQLIAVPEDGCHTVEVGGRWHKETILPWWSRGRASSMPNVSHWTTHLMGCHMGRVMDPLQKSLDPGGLEFRDLTNKSNGSSAGHGNVFSVCLFFLHKKGPQFLSENHLGAEFICNKQWDDSKKTKKKKKRRVKGHFLLSAYESVRNITLTGDCFSSVDALYALWENLKGECWVVAKTEEYLSLVPASCVVPSWYRMSMVESEERPFSRPNSRGLFKSLKKQYIFWWC